MPFRSGVSFSTIEGAADSLPGHLNGEVFVTPTSHFAYYAGKGMDHIRLEGSWERLQPRLNGPLGEQLFDHYGDPNNPLRNPVSLVKHYLDQAHAHGLKVILDLCHNYGERWVGYDGSWGRKSKAQLGSSAVPISARNGLTRRRRISTTIVTMPTAKSNSGYPSTGLLLRGGESRTPGGDAARRRGHRPSSLSCLASTGAGAPVIRSRAFWFLGNAITSRMFAVPDRIIAIRSSPIAMPPCGGAPYFSASSRKPNRARACSSLMPSTRNA